MPMGIKGPLMYQDINVYDSFASIYIPVKIPFNPGYVITNATLKLGFDLNRNAYGMVFYNSNNTEGFIINGKMEANEKNFETKPGLWRCFTGDQGTLIMTVEWDDTLGMQADVFSSYLDSKSISSPPEDEKGSVGYCSTDVKISYVEPGVYYFNMAFFCPPNFSEDKHVLPQQSIDECLKIREHPLKIYISGQSVQNETANVKPLQF